MFVLVLIILILFPEGAREGAEEGLKVAFDTVIVSILPFSVMCCALVYSGFSERLGRFFMPAARLFHINPYGMTALFTGFLAGYPTGCKMAGDMYSEGLIEKEEAEKILAYANNGGLIFALNVVGEGIFKSKGAGGLVFAVSAISALVTAILLGKSREREIIATKKEKLPFMTVLGKSVASGGGVILNITSSFIVFYAISNALGLYRFPFLEGCVEMTKGIMHAGEAHSLPLAAFFFTLGGVGVFSQSAAILSNHNLSLKWYVKGKILSASVAFLIMYIITERPFFCKETILLSFLAFLAVIVSVKAIKKLYTLA